MEFTCCQHQFSCFSAYHGKQEFLVISRAHLRYAMTAHIEEANALSSGEELLPNL